MIFLKNSFIKKIKNHLKTLKCAQFEDKYAKDKSYHKVSNNCHFRSKFRGAAHSKCNLKYSIPK